MYVVYVMAVYVGWYVVVVHVGCVWWCMWGAVVLGWCSGGVGVVYVVVVVVVVVAGGFFSRSLLRTYI